MKKIYELIGKCLFQALLFSIIIKVCEMLGLLMVYIKTLNREILFPGEMGIIFFIVLMVALFIIEVIHEIINRYKK